MKFLILFLVLALQAADTPDAKTRDEYQALVKQLDLESHPERHAQAAAWCQSKKWKSKADFHDLESRRYTYRKEREKLKSEPTAADLKRVVELALKLKLEAETTDARAAWLDAELRERRAKLKADDAAGLKALVSWAAKEGAGRLAAPLAEELLKLDPTQESAHLILGHLKRGSEWIDPWQYLVSKGGLKDAAVRGAVHKEIAALRPKRVSPFPANPLTDCERVQKGKFSPAWKMRVRSGDGQSIAYLFVPANYSAARAYPLIIYLHGGGNGDFAMSEDGSYGMAQEFYGFYPNTDAIVVCPAARNHVMDSWKFRENAFDVIDAVIDCCDRFNIDRRRIYLEGASMGGQGAQVLSWTVPELCSAFCPQAGYYLNDRPVPDLTGKHYLVFHGGKDTVVGQKTHEPFMDKLRGAGAAAELVFWPDLGHQLPHAKVVPQMLEFFKKHQLDYEPDLALVRRMTEELLPWNKRPEGAAAAPAPAMPREEPGRGPKPASPPGTAIDLLEKIDPSKDAVSGTWRLEGRTLVSPSSEFARLKAPVAVPEEYDVRVVVERGEGAKPDSLVVGLVGGGSPFMVGLDGAQGTKSGLDAIEGKSFNNGNETTQTGAVLATDKPSTILVSVRKDRVTLSVDGKTVVDWKADYGRVSLRESWSIPGAKALFLGCYKCAYRITKWELLPVGAR